MRRVVFLLLALFLVGVVLAVATGQFLVVAQRIAHASQVTGTVMAWRPGQTAYSPLSEATNVLAGSTVLTGPASGVTLNWVDGSRLRVGANSEMTVLKCQVNRDKSQVSLFRLKAGQVLVRVRRLLAGESKFEIETPTATAGVRGTIFSVKVEASGQTQVNVLEGQVDLRNATSEVQVRPGGQGRVQGAGTAAELAKQPPLEQAAWARDQSLFGPYLELISPRAGGSVGAGTVMVRGKTEPGATVTVNGQSAKVNDSNWFNFPLSLQPGATRVQVTVVATDERDYTTTVEREVTVGAS
ncbi:MAG TPA: FecR domain-containing protein [Armatimonadota bacterium]|jgi:hypothetical protein